MRVKIEKGKAVGVITVPPSKSVAQRDLILAALVGRGSRIRRVPTCEDVLATLDALKALGADCSINGDEVEFVSAVSGAPRSEVFCRQSAATLRFLIPVALLSGQKTRFSAEPALLNRPLGPFEALAEEKGFLLEKDERGVTVAGKLTPGEYRLPGDVSSQFISGLMFALPLLGAPSSVTLTTPPESRPYLVLTLEALSRFGFAAFWDGDRSIKIPGGQRGSPAAIIVEGDASAAAVFTALNVFGGSVTARGVPENSRQADRAFFAFYPRLAEKDPCFSVRDCPDLAPLLMALCAFLGKGELTDTRRLAYKESDRARVMARELEKCGAKIEVEENRVTFHPALLHAPAVPLSGNGDHRIVMALAALLVALGGAIEGAEAVAKSYPAFFNDLRSLGIRVTEK